MKARNPFEGAEERYNAQISLRHQRINDIITKAQQPLSNSLTELTKYDSELFEISYPKDFSIVTSEQVREIANKALSEKNLDKKLESKGYDMQGFLEDIVPTVGFVANSDKTASFGINIEKMQEGKTLETYVEQLKENIDFADFALMFNQGHVTLTSCKEVSVSGEKAYELIYTYSLPGREITHKNVCVCKDDSVYTLGYKSKIEKFGSLSMVGDRMIDTFKFK